MTFEDAVAEIRKEAPGRVTVVSYSSLNSSNARSTRWIFHCLGQSVATVMSPSGGTRERSGAISITSPRIQK